MCRKASALPLSQTIVNTLTGCFCEYTRWDSPLKHGDAPVILEIVDMYSIDAVSLGTTTRRIAELQPAVYLRTAILISV